MVFFNQSAPGSGFFLPAGAHLYRKLEELIRDEYRRRGYQEVISPNLFHGHLFEVSGHADKYAEDMFVVDVDNKRHFLKPMNCPGHALMYQQLQPSQRQLPLRLAEFGVCHRNEKSGALSGLRRVRRFCQDDAHIFCLASQVQSEVAGVLDFVHVVYSKLGLEYSLELSSRPEQFIGEIEVWEHAEAQLRAALDMFAPSNWSLEEGGGAFYGPKIDIKVKDVSGRELQCASIQLDFQLPERFDLKLAGGSLWCLHDDCLEELEPFECPEALAQHSKDEHGMEPPERQGVRPVMIHRAVLGSLERMLSVIIEAHGSDWPFWLAPRQVLVLPKDPGNAVHVARSKQVCVAVSIAGFAASVDHSQQSLNLRLVVADGRHSHRGVHERVAVVVIIGDREVESGRVAARINGEPCSPVEIEELVSMLQALHEASQAIH